MGDARIEPDESVATLPPDPDVGPSSVRVPTPTAHTLRDGGDGQDTGAAGVSVQAEVLAFLGEHEGSMASLAGSVAAGPFDRAWMRRCPVIAPLRADAGWPQLEARVTERADEIRDTFFGKLP